MNRLIFALAFALLAFALLLANTAAAQGILPPQSSGPGNSNPADCDAICEEQKEKAKETAAAHDKRLAESKSIRDLQIAFTHADPCDDGRPFLRPFITWFPPSDGNSLDFYRVNWTPYDSWPSYKQANNRKRGNAFIKDNLDAAQRFIVPVDNWPEGKTLKVRVRAGYEDQNNGPWVKVSLAWPCS